MKVKYTKAKFSSNYLDVTFNAIEYKEVNIDHIETLLDVIRENGNTAIITAYDEDTYHITMFDTPFDEWKQE